MMNRKDKRKEVKNEAKDSNYKRQHPTDLSKTIKGNVLSDKSLRKTNDLDQKIVDKQNQIKQEFKDYKKLIDHRADIEHKFRITRKGYCIFNFVTHDEVAIVKYYHKLLKKVYDEDPDCQSIVRSDYNYMYYSDLPLALKGIINLVRSERHPHKDYSTKKEVSQINESNILIKLNEVSNRYLVEIGIIKHDQQHGYCLTHKGTDIVNRPIDYLETFFTNNMMSYEPNVPYTDILLPALLMLQFVRQHEDFKKYYGLAFAIGVINRDVFFRYACYTDKNNQDHLYSQNNIVVFRNIMLMFDALFKNPNVNYGKYHYQMRISSINYLKQLENIDKIIEEDFAHN